MSNFPYRKIWLISVFVLSVILLSGCGSSQHAGAGKGGGYTSSQKLTPSQEKELVKEAKKWIGTKYRYGGHSRSGTDCSGMVMEVYKKVCGVKLPRSSREQQAFCKKIKRENLRKGDLVFFSTGKSRKSVSHVGLYIGDGEIVHASASKGVMISSLNEKYFQRTYHSSGRVLASAGAKAVESVRPMSPSDGSAREISLDEFIKKSDSSNKKEQKIDVSPERRAEALDSTLSSKLLEDIIDQKIDSIYSTMFD